MGRKEFERRHIIYLRQQEQFRKQAAKQREGDADAMADPEQYTTPSKVQINLDIDDVDID